MWKIEIIDLHKKPAKVRVIYFSKLPSLDRLQRMDRFAIMTRISPDDPACSSCKRVLSIAAHIQKQQEMRATVGSTVVLFPYKEQAS